MSDVEFSEEEAYLASLRRPAVKKQTAKGLFSVPVRLGLAKDEKGATVILAGVAVISFVLTFVIFSLAV